MNINMGAFLLGPSQRSGTLAGEPVTLLYNAPAQVNQMGGAGAAVVEHTAWLPTASVPSAWLDAPLVISEGTFKVKQHMPDGLGGSVLYLQP